MLGRWMRMFTIPNQSSVPKAYTQFTDAVDPSNEQAYLEAEGGSRLMPSGNRDRLVDCMEEFVKYTIIMRQHFDLFNDRHSERMEKQAKLEKQKAEEAKAVDKAGEEGNAKSIGSATVVNGVDVGGL
jgi:arsenic resistance protein ArsH